MRIIDGTSTDGTSTMSAYAFAADSSSISCPFVDGWQDMNTHERWNTFCWIQVKSWCDSASMHEADASGGGASGPASAGSASGGPASAEPSSSPQPDTRVSVRR